MKNKKILLEETYIKMIENSVDTKMFNSLFVKDDDGKPKDVLNDGEFSCAIFVSSLLSILSLQPKPRATVNNLKGDLENNPLFIKISEDDIEIGDIIFWNEIEYEDGSKNKHVGFYVGNEQAISTSYKEKKVVKHNYTKFNGVERNVIDLYRIDWLRIK